MRSRRLLCASVAVVLVAGGCSNPQSKKTVADGANGSSAIAGADVQTDAPPVQDVAAARQAAGRPDALADATAQYAQRMEQMMSRPVTPATQPMISDPTDPPATAVKGTATGGAKNEVRLPSMEWLEKSYSLTLGPPQQPAVRPTVAKGLEVEISGPTIRPSNGASTAAALTSDAGTAAAGGKPNSLASGDVDGELSSRLTDAVRQRPRDVVAHLDYQLFQFVQNRATPQLDTISTLPAEDRELVSVLLDGLNNFRNGARGDGSALRASKVRPLLEMGDRLRGATDLRIPTATLCRKVDGFGAYEAIEPRLRAGVPQSVIVYCEVENFTSQFNARRLWETRLTKEAALFNERGVRVWHDNSPTPPDVCRARRKDFSLAKIARFPALAPGRYTLTITVVDQLANRMTEEAIPLTVGAER